MCTEYHNNDFKNDLQLLIIRNGTKEVMYTFALTSINVIEESSKAAITV